MIWCFPAGGKQASSVSVATVSEQFIKENPDVVQNTYAVDHEMSALLFRCRAEE